MLPIERRVRRPADFASTVRAGRRAATPGLVAHVSVTATSTPARAGFVVAKSVGPAVVRNRVRRRLRHLMAPRLVAMPPGTDVVIRVLPTAARQSRAELAAGLAGALDRALASAGRA